MDRAVLAVVLVLAVLIAGALWVAGRRRAGRRLYVQRLDEALADGILTQEEIAELDVLRERHEITRAQARMAALAVYRRALRDAVVDHELTAEEDAALHRLEEQLALRPSDIHADKTQLSRLRLLGRVTAGDLPVVRATGVTLVPDEQAHWVVRATLAERLALPRPGRTPLRPVEFDVDAETAFSAPSNRDALKPQDDILPRDPGILIITSHRTIFQGAKRTHSLPHARLQRVALYADGIRLDEGQSSDSQAGALVRRFFLVDDAELTAACALHAARLRREHVRPATRPHRSA